MFVAKRSCGILEPKTFGDRKRSYEKSKFQRPHKQQFQLGAVRGRCLSF